MNQIFLDISQRFLHLGTNIEVFFEQSGIVLLWIIVLYIVIIGVLIRGLRSARHAYHSLNTMFETTIDDLYYQTSLILYHHHEDIYDLEHTLPLLLKYKTEELAKYDKANYYTNYDKLIEEINYIAALTGETITIHRTELDQQQSIIQRLSSRINKLRMGLIAASFGVAKMFI